jgi:hypothetical protein
MENFSALSREALLILFRTFPGGGALHWIFRSPRWSFDLDLKPLGATDRRFLEDVSEALSKQLVPLGLSLGVAISCLVDEPAQCVRILADGRPVLHVELATLAPVSGSEKHLLQSDSLQSEIIVTPDVHQLLFAKAAALVKRPRLKGRDVFDIWFLESRGAKLDNAAFAYWLKWEEKSAEDVRATLAAITPARLEADLQRFLPPALHDQLAAEDYKTLIAAAEKLLRPFL